MTLVELIVAFTILALLSSMSVPLARYKVRRNQERELRYALKEIHKAIEDYKDATLTGKIETKPGTEGYPESLDQLVEGVKLLQSPDGKKIKFLRRIPLDPMTNTREWGLRSVQDDPKSQTGGGRMFFRFTQRVSRGREMAHAPIDAPVGLEWTYCPPSRVATAEPKLSDRVARFEIVTFCDGGSRRLQRR